ncbi:hypothetical protein LCGC14_2399540, partial [marine sediment metagenome]
MTTERKAIVDKIYYEYGKQNTDFRVVYTYEKNGDTEFSKWIPYLKAQENPELIKKINQREQLKNEIILDQDKGDYKVLIERLKADGLKFYAYSTEDDRARHIHLFFKGLAQLNKLEREKVREFFINRYGCDSAYKIDKKIIPLENVEHWKTGKVKKLIAAVEGENDVEIILKEMPPEAKAVLRVTNFMYNVEQFYLLQPFFYDKANLFWLWKENKWQIVDDTDILNAIDEELNLTGEIVTSTIKNAYLEAFKRIGRKHIPENAKPTWIQFDDEIVDIETDEIFKATPKYFFTNPIPHEVGESDSTPVLDKLFKEWVGEKYVSTIYETLA